jgi:hypothetical protein
VAQLDEVAIAAVLGEHADRGVGVDGERVDQRAGLRAAADDQPHAAERDDHADAEQHRAEPAEAGLALGDHVSLTGLPPAVDE